MPTGMAPQSQYEELTDIGFDGINMLGTKPIAQKQYVEKYGHLIMDEKLAAYIHRAVKEF